MLTDIAIRKAVPRETPYKLADAFGLYLLVNPKGGKWWRIDYRLDGKRKTLSAGTYPTISLKEAREIRDGLRKELALGLDPSENRKATRRSTQDEQPQGETFQTVASEWHANQSLKWEVRHADRTMERLRKRVFPFIGKEPLDTVTSPAVLALLRRMEAEGKTELTHKVRGIISCVFQYGIVTGKCLVDPTPSHKALKPHKTRHRSAITDPKRLGQLLRDIDGYSGTMVVKSALKLAPLLALRPGELRHLEWTEIDLAEKEIRIPAEKMKMRRVHLVPLAPRAISILKGIQPYTGNGRYVFPSSRSRKGDKPMSENTINAALRYLGYEQDEICGHGLRGTFCSIASEKLNFSRDAIERQLAHVENNNVRAAYLHSEFLPERRRLMNAWAEYLEHLFERPNSIGAAK